MSQENSIISFRILSSYLFFAKHLGRDDVDSMVVSLQIQAESSFPPQILGRALVRLEPRGLGGGI